MLRRVFSRGSSSRSSEGTSWEAPRYNLPRVTEVRSCEWSCETFMNGAGIKQEFNQFVENAGLTAFLVDKCSQYYQLTDTFVQDFCYISSHTAPRVVFHLYDKSYSLSLEEFCYICKIPFWGSFDEPQERDYEAFLRSLYSGETRGVT